MAEILKESGGSEMMTLGTYPKYLDEQWKIPEKVDRKSEVKKMKEILQKKKTPAYVAQFGIKKSIKKEKKHL